MKLKTILALIFLMIGSVASFAQGIPGKSAIRGRLIDSATRKPAEFVTVSLSNTNKQQIKVVAGKIDGTFVMTDIQHGKFVLNFLLLGYNTKTIDVTIDNSKQLLDLGEIVINTASKQLKTVSVKAARPVISQEADRLAYDVQADPAGKHSTVLEMMRKVPMLTVDGEDNVQLNGASGARIFINGKPSSLMERNAKDVLKSMPASSIQKIEVITTPSSKYDAEGVAGIINIVTNKALADGYNANISLNHRLPLGGPSVGGAYSTKSGKLGLSLFGGAGSANTPTTTNDIARTGKNGATSALFQYGDREKDDRNAYLGIELSYELDSLDLLSGQFNINGSKGTGSIFQNSVLRNNGVVEQVYDLFNQNDNNGRGADAAINYQKGYRRHKNQLTTLSYRYFGFANEQNADQRFANRLDYDLPNFRQANRSIMNEHTVQLDHVYPINKSSIEAGAKAIYRTNESDFKYLSADAADNYAIDPAKTNTFNNMQTILAAYSSYQYSAKSWSVKAGVRLENTIIDADFLTTATQVKQNYFNVVPSVVFSRRFKTTGITFGWNQRIQRPGINQLNPFVDRSNPSFETTGNPDLRPTQGNQIRIGFDRTGKWNLVTSLVCNWINGLIFPVSQYDEATTITRTRFENTGGAIAAGTNINFTYPISPALGLSLNGSLVHGWADGISNGQPIKNRGFMYNCNLATNLKLNNGWRVGANAYLNGGQLTVQQRSNAYVTTTLNASKDIIKDKLTFSALVNNPFDKYRLNVTNAFGPNFDQLSNDQQNFRVFGASLNYKFGKLKEAIKKNKRGINNDDVSN
ncbi:outer membrane beta-barrel family protein [Mucilaginibacter myungsuensis]|uniref:TonB-dependent receptor n=1 Tax=Mucilaginibacter myungsuensis TaxID=649104 RepID=A0A929PZK6_9SPHI|nr:outer membrane beta-barrel family protein [Mucilaginibacter myungsuensis]MBE9664522.1 TonB-dependent receptor [Mucilaginibacter myungsuensis]MDN3601333.1 TonB-dependent receptor [Mucilaginibacter myungsuensis]